MLLWALTQEPQPAHGDIAVRYILRICRKMSCCFSGSAVIGKTCILEELCHKVR